MRKDIGVQLLGVLTVVTAVALPSTAHAVPAAPPPEQEMWLASPAVDSEIPPNAVFTFVASLPDAPMDNFLVEVAAAGGVPERVFPLAAGCEGRGHCSVAVRTTLPPSVEVTLSITDPGGAITLHEFTTGAEVDLEPPAVPALSVEELGVQARNNEDNSDWILQRVLVLRASPPTDDFLVSGVALFRSLNGGASTPVDFILLDLSARFHQTLDEDEATGEGCYAAVAWDAAGNEGRSEETCVTLDITEEEAAPFRNLPPPWVTGGCAASGSGRSSPLLPVGSCALVLLVLRRRRAA